jgi:hypothetical protein
MKPQRKQGTATEMYKAAAAKKRERGGALAHIPLPRIFDACLFPCERKLDTYCSLYKKNSHW